MEILGPKIKRSKCTYLACENSDGWNKAIDIFRDFILKNLIKQNKHNHLNHRL